MRVSAGQGRAGQGRKTLAAITDSQQKLQAYVFGKTNEAVQAEMAGFLEAVKRAVAVNQGK